MNICTCLSSTNVVHPFLSSHRAHMHMPPPYKMLVTSLNSLRSSTCSPIQTVITYRGPTQQLCFKKPVCPVSTHHTHARALRIRLAAGLLYTCCEQNTFPYYPERTVTMHVPHKAALAILGKAPRNRPNRPSPTV